MNKIRAIIVDDEPLAREGIKKLLKNEKNIKIIGECGNGEEAIEAINNLEPDLIFLDIQMPEFDGFDVLKNINLSDLPAVVFITAYDQYAIKAFEVNALDYLLKPFSDDRFRTTLHRVLNFIKNKRKNELNEKIFSLIDRLKLTGGNEDSAIKEDISNKDKKYLSRIMIKEKGKIFFVDVDEIKWFEAMDYYVKIHTADSFFLLRESLSNLEKSLNPGEFFRIHRSTIVRFREIKTLVSVPTGDYKVVMKDGTNLKLSRTRKALLEKYLR